MDFFQFFTCLLKVKIIVMKGIMLVLATFISDPYSLTSVKQFIEQYGEDLPSPSIVDAELVFWHQLWTRK